MLLKSGTPFNVVSGSDAPGFGNVDGNGSDRPNLLDPSILARTIGGPDTSRSMLPRAAFAFMRPTDDRGNLGRNVFRKGGIHNVNAALSRTWTIRSDKRLTFAPSRSTSSTRRSSPNRAWRSRTLTSVRLRTR